MLSQDTLLLQHMLTTLRFVEGALCSKLPAASLTQCAAARRALASSSELRAFLTTHEELRGSGAWAAASATARAGGTSVLGGTSKLLQKLVRREAMTPDAEEAAQPTGESGDVVRHVRERVYALRHRKCAPACFVVACTVCLCSLHWIMKTFSSALQLQLRTARCVQGR